MSITRFTATSFKGWTGDQELTERTLFIGPNGAGKSARSQALQLAVNGGVIVAGKTNDDILSTFGEGDKLIVGVEIDGKYLFERGYVRKSDGSVSQGYKVNGAKASKEFFMKSLGESGAPVVLNVADFMTLSDQKKIEALFALYPPTGDVSSVQGKIDEAKTRINALTQKVKTSEQAAARIAASKMQIQVPAGTLAEIDAEIAKLERDLSTARNNLTEIKIDEQKAESERKAKEDAARKEKEMERIEAKGKERQEIMRQVDAIYYQNDRFLGAMSDQEFEEMYRPYKIKWDEAHAIQDPPLVTEEQVLASLAERPGEMTKKCDALFGPEKVNPLMDQYPSVAQAVQGVIANDGFVKSIQSIITAMDEAGCGACAAKMIARRELRKYKEVAQ